MPPPPAGYDRRDPIPPLLADGPPPPLRLPALTIAPTRQPPRDLTCPPLITSVYNRCRDRRPCLFPGSSPHPHHLPHVATALGQPPLARHLGRLDTPCRRGRGLPLQSHPQLVLRRLSPPLAGRYPPVPITRWSLRPLRRQGLNTPAGTASVGLVLEKIAWSISVMVVK